MNTSRIISRLKHLVVAISINLFLILGLILLNALIITPVSNLVAAYGINENQLTSIASFVIGIFPFIGILFVLINLGIGLLAVLKVVNLGRTLKVIFYFVWGIGVACVLIILSFLTYSIILSIPTKV